MNAPVSSSSKVPSKAEIVRMVAGREISTKLRDKAYLISIVVFLAIIGVVIGFNVVMNSGNDEYTVGVVGEAAPGFEDAAAAQAKELDSTITFSEMDDLDAAKSALEDGDVDVVLDGDTLIRKGSLSTELSAALQGAHQAVGMQEQAAEQGIDPGTLSSVMTVQPLDEQSLSADDDTDIERGIVAIASVGIAYGMMMMIIQFVAQGVVEEKSSRVVELLMTAVKPRQLLAGKVLGLGVLGFMQLALVVGVGLIGTISTGILSIPGSAVSTVLQVLAWYILGYAFIATLTAAAASLVSRQEDLGSAMMPMTFIPMLAFFGAFKVLSSPNDAFSTILSLVPGFSPTTMPVRAAMTDVPIWQYVVAIVLQVAAIYFLIRVAARVYSGAMLRTSGKLKARDAIANDRVESGV